MCGMWAYRSGGNFMAHPSSASSFTVASTDDVGALSLFLQAERPPLSAPRVGQARPTSTGAPLSRVQHTETMQCAAARAEQDGGGAAAAARLAACAAVLACAAAASRLCVHGRFSSEGWRLGTLCVLRLAAGLLGLALLPPPPPVAQPGSGVVCRASAALAGAPGFEALLLAACALVLPLPLKAHLWVQALLMRSALTRARSAAQAAAGAGSHCCSAVFVRGIRLAVQAAVPGAEMAAHPLPAQQRCCIMQRSWLVLMIGFILPSAVVAALEQVARQLADQRHWQGRLRSGRISSSASSIKSSSGSSAANGVASGSDGTSAGSSGAGSSGSGVLLQWGAALRHSKRRALAAFWVAHPAAQAAAHLWSWLLLLLPAGTAVWVALEVQAALSADWL
ncbi:hypothetical protein ABPG75_008400 [Micractinium tetrahymenae]